MKKKIKEVICNRTPVRIFDPGLSPAAVIVPIYEKEGQYFILLTERSIMVENHGGRISFPGGRKKDSDGDLLQTALRECHEEIGVHPNDLEIVGKLDEAITYITDLIVTPFLAFIPYPYPFKLECADVEALIEIPFESLQAQADSQREKAAQGIRSNMISFDLHDYQMIWGATARILKGFFDALHEYDVRQNIKLAQNNQTKRASRLNISLPSSARKSK
ncbi:MAG: CoA pyrophosphatase [Chloroflexota bacterium]|nr:CoA pyrophosphatase [Chloroflexota bacterium]